MAAGTTRYGAQIDDPAPLPPPRPARPLVVHWAVDAAVAFLAVLFLAFVAGLPIVWVATAAGIIGLLAAPWTRRAEIRALAAREAAREPGRDAQ